jgi:hypothetical protein
MFLEYCVCELQEMLESAPDKKFPIFQACKLVCGVDQVLETCLEHYLFTNMPEILEKSLLTNISEIIDFFVWSILPVITYLSEMI